MIKKLWIAVLILIVAGTLFSTSYALWRQNAEVKFRLTISAPAHNEFLCPNCTYDTVQEGIDLHKNVRYPALYGMMDDLKKQLQDRLTELNSLPVGSITSQELTDECNGYTAQINQYGDMINNFGKCINRLSDFFNGSPQDEKDKVPDFWTQQRNLWALSDNLWSKRQELYDALNAVRSAGQSRIDWNKHD